MSRSTEIKDNVIYLRCTRHPRYEAKRKPTSTCDVCWRVWLQKVDREDWRKAQRDNRPMAHQ